jgi:hypothetical protein
MLCIQSHSAVAERVRETPPNGLRGASTCRRKFLRFFREGFVEPTYVAWEREYKWEAHQHWEELLNETEIETPLDRRDYGEIARQATQIESRTNLLFSFQKMAFRDAVRSVAGARLFATGLHEFLCGQDLMESKFTRWCDAIATLARKRVTMSFKNMWRFGAARNPHTVISTLVCFASATRRLTTSIQGPSTVNDVFPSRRTVRHSSRILIDMSG